MEIFSEVCILCWREVENWTNDTGEYAPQEEKQQNDEC